MGGTARPLHDPGNDGTVERRSLRQAARRGRLTSPANPAGDLERPRALTPPPGARSGKSYEARACTQACERASRRDDLGAKASPLKGQKSQPFQALASAQTVVPQIDSMPTDSGANSLPRRKEPPSQPRQLALS